jgi:hypothetical protein
MSTAHRSRNSIVEKTMKRFPFLALAVLVSVFAFPGHAQDAMKKEAAVKPADPEWKVVLDSWNEIGQKLVAMAEDFPEDKYDFKPTSLRIKVYVMQFEGDKISHLTKYGTPV